MRFDERVSAEKFRENLYKMIGRGASQKDINMYLTANAPVVDEYGIARVKVFDPLPMLKAKYSID